MNIYPDTVMQAQSSNTSPVYSLTSPSEFMTDWNPAYPTTYYSNPHKTEYLPPTEEYYPQSQFESLASHQYYTPYTPDAHYLYPTGFGAQRVENSGEQEFASCYQPIQFFQPTPIPHHIAPQNPVIQKKNCDDAPIKRRRGTTYSSFQLNMLSARFKKSDSIPIAERKELSARINLTPEQIRIWFQNRRYQIRKEKLKMKVLKQ